MDIVLNIEYLASLHGMKIDFEKDVLLRDDGNGVYISEWHLPFPQPTTEELMSLDVPAKTWLKSQEYIANRKSEYPSIQDQLDMLYWDKVNGTTNWQDKITEIKEKYPKS